MTVEAGSGAPVHVEDPASVAIDAPLPPALQPYARSRARWRIGCTVDVLSDGQETFAAMLAAIAILLASGIGASLLWPKPTVEREATRAP